MSRFRNACITWNNPTENPVFIEKTMSYLVYQLEKGENGTPRYQIYVEFKNQLSMRKIKKMFHDTVHIAQRTGTAKQASDYCKKEDTREEKGEEFGTISKQGGKVNTTETKDVIMRGEKMVNDIQRETTIPHHQHERTYSKVEDDKMLVVADTQKETVLVEKTNQNKRKLTTQLMDDESKIRKMETELSEARDENSSNIPVTKSCEAIPSGTSKAENLQLELERYKQMCLKLEKMNAKITKGYERMLTLTADNVPIVERLSFLKQSGQSKLYKANMILPNSKTSKAFCIKHLTDGHVRKVEAHIQAHLNDLRCVRHCYANISVPMISRTALVFDFYDGSLREINDPRLSTYNSHNRLFPKTIKLALEALHEVHKRNIIHLDVKPHNFFYNLLQTKQSRNPTEGSDIHVVIGDFGLSIALEDGADDEKECEKFQNDTTVDIKSTMGTEFYRAPEIYRKKVCKASDIYSFGMTMLLLFTRHNKLEEVIEILRQTEYKVIESPLLLESRSGTNMQLSNSSQTSVQYKVENPDKTAMQAAREIFGEGYFLRSNTKDNFAPRDLMSPKTGPPRENENVVHKFALYIKSTVIEMLNVSPALRPSIETVLERIEKFEDMNLPPKEQHTL